MNSQDKSNNRSPLLWSLALALLGGLLLLNNFILLGNFQIIDLWPILLVILGAALLLRGDLLPNQNFRTFGITRGSIESATLEINSGEIDISIAALQTPNSERLIAGQYAQDSRPELDVQDVHAYLTMARHQTPFLSFANWEMGLSQDLPWQIVASSHMGQISADFSHVIVQNALLNTGIGDIHLVCPSEAFESIYMRSLVGNIVITTPIGYNVRISIENNRFFDLVVDETRYEQIEDGSYISIDSDDNLPVVDLIINGTFGSAYLS